MGSMETPFFMSSDRTEKHALGKHVPLSLHDLYIVKRWLGMYRIHIIEDLIIMVKHTIFQNSYVYTSNNILILDSGHKFFS